MAFDTSCQGNGMNFINLCIFKSLYINVLHCIVCLLFLIKFPAFNALVFRRICKAIFTSKVEFGHWILSWIKSALRNELKMNFLMFGLGFAIQQPPPSLPFDQVANFFKILDKRIAF
jgi:hypothetical protein